MSHLYSVFLPKLNFGFLFLQLFVDIASCERRVAAAESKFPLGDPLEQPCKHTGALALTACVDPSTTQAACTQCEMNFPAGKTKEDV